MTPEFKTHVRNYPQVSVELLVVRDGDVLLCKRTIPPADGQWFVPGSVLQKDESLRACAHRVADEELGIDIRIQDFAGVEEHFWDDAGLGDDSRHTVNIVFRVTPTETEITLDRQHSAAQFVSPGDIGEEYHKYVRRYTQYLGGGA